MAVDRSALKAQLRERGKESYNRREAYSDNSIGIWVPNAVKELSSSQFAEQAHFIDVIPFVAGRYWPTRLNFGGTGQWAPYMELFIHVNVGPMKGEYPCPAANWGQACPICEHQSRLRSDWTDPSEEQTAILKSMYPKRRCLYNVRWVNDAKTESMGVMVLNMAHFTLQRHIESLVIGRSGEPEIFYADPDDGKTIQFTRQGKGITTQYIGVQFADRDYQLTDDELEQAYVLDEMLVLPKDDAGEVIWSELYKTIKRAFFATEDDEPVETHGSPTQPTASVTETEPGRARRNPPMSAQVVTSPPTQSTAEQTDVVASEVAAVLPIEASTHTENDVQELTQAQPTQGRRGRAVQSVHTTPSQVEQAAPLAEQPIRSRRRSV